MPRINTNVMSLRARHDMQRVNTDLATSLRRLSSGLRINSARDDPAGLIISEYLRSEITSTRRAIDNTTRASNMLATAEGRLHEVSNLLGDLQSLLVEGANTGALTSQEIGALQVQIDSSVASIDRIANSTTFGGKQLLNGNLDFTFSAADPINNLEVRDVQVHQVSLEAGDSMTVNYSDLVPTTEGRVTFNTNADAVDGLVVEVAGADGSMTFNFDPGTTAADMRSTIDAASDITGVQSNGNDLVSTGKGSDDFVRINIVSGAGGGAEGYYEGTDGEVTVNGQTFVERDGVYHVNLPNLKLSMKVLNIAGDGNFTINGGGAIFQITGNVGVAGQVRIGIGSVTSSGLGDSFDGHLSDLVTGGSLSLVDGTELGDAAEVVEEAILKVATLRGRLGALQRNTLETNRNSLQVALENLVASESRIRDTDFARETAELTRNRILAQASTSVLATANRTPSLVLSLLR